MGKEIWLSMHPRHFGFEKIAHVRPSVGPPLHVSRGEIFHFKYPGVNCITTRTFRDKKTTTTKPILSFDLFLIFTLTRITEKELEREKKKKTNKQRPISLEEKHENFIAVVRK